MTFRQLQDEVIALAYDSSLRNSVKSWINLEYQYIWESGAWNFKSVPFANLTVPGASNQPTMPADFGKVVDLYDPSGSPLLYLRQKDWESAYLNSSSAAAAPSGAYTVINRQIYLGSTLTTGSTYKLSYLRRLSHVDSVSGVIGGVMVNDLDQPLWPAEHDYTLVYGAAARGATLTNRLDAQSYSAERDKLLQSMKNDLVNDVDGQIEQWGSVWGVSGSW